MRSSPRRLARRVAQGKRRCRAGTPYESPYWIYASGEIWGERGERVGWTKNLQSAKSCTPPGGWVFDIRTRLKYARFGKQWKIM